MAADSLLHEFPPVPTQAWEEAIRSDLKGADYARRLIWQSDEGLAVKPYYRAEDSAALASLLPAPGTFPYLRGNRTSGDWRIREEIHATDAADANHQALAAIAGGAEEISFLAAHVTGPGSLSILLSQLEQVPVRFHQADEGLLRRLIAAKIATPISTDWDPGANLDFAAEITPLTAGNWVPFTIPGERLGEMGATAVQEIGFTLAAGIDFLAGMQSRKIDLNRAVASMCFSFSIDTGFFFQIAKLRAFRLLWARAVESFGGDAAGASAKLYVRTSRWNETIYDPHVNVLRATTEAMSAALGGADSISGAPWDECYATPGAGSRRLARNTQIILKREALLSQVADAGGGSYGLEVITDFVAREAWKTMQQVEAAGGYAKAKSEGFLARTLEPSLASKKSAVDSRRRILTGTNQHPNPAEQALGRIDPALIKNPPRGAGSYEFLRLRTELHVAETGADVLVLLAEIGEARMAAARSSFCANFFGCAGFSIQTRRFNSPAEIVDVAASLIVLCSSDPEYLALAADLIPRLHAAGRQTPVLVAGDPASAPALQAAGVADFVHVRSNPIEVLTRWQRKLGIRAGSADWIGA